MHFPMLYELFDEPSLKSTFLLNWKNFLENLLISYVYSLHYIPDEIELNDLKIYYLLSFIYT